MLRDLCPNTEEHRWFCITSGRGRVTLLPLRMINRSKRSLKQERDLFEDAYRLSTVTTCNPNIVRIIPNVSKFYNGSILHFNTTKRVLISAGLNRSFHNPVITANESFTRTNVTSYDMFENHWHNDLEVQRHFWTTSFLLPIGSIIMLGIVVLLMVLFKRYPHMVAAVVTGILAIIVIFASVVSFNHTPVYD